jgi:hypothetical protein
MVVGPGRGVGDETTPGFRPVTGDVLCIPYLDKLRQAPGFGPAPFFFRAAPGADGPVVRTPSFPRAPAFCKVMGAYANAPGG